MHRYPSLSSATNDEHDVPLFKISSALELGSAPCRPPPAAPAGRGCERSPLAVSCSANSLRCRCIPSVISIAPSVVSSNDVTPEREVLTKVASLTCHFCKHTDDLAAVIHLVYVAQTCRQKKATHKMQLSTSVRHNLQNIKTSNTHDAAQQVNETQLAAQHNKQHTRRSSASQ